MAKEHADKVKRGEARAHGSGYGGSGFKFDTAEEDKEQAKKMVRTGLHCYAWVVRIAFHARAQLEV